MNHPCAQPSPFGDGQRHALAAIQAGKILAARLIHSGELDQGAMRQNMGGDLAAQEAFELQFGASLAIEAAQSLKSRPSGSLTGAEAELSRFAQGVQALGHGSRELAIDLFKSELAFAAPQHAQTVGRRQACGPAASAALGDALIRQPFSQHEATQLLAWASRGPREESAQEAFAIHCATHAAMQAAAALRQSGAASLSKDDPALAQFAQAVAAMPHHARASAVGEFKALLAEQAPSIADSKGGAINEASLDALNWALSRQALDHPQRWEDAPRRAKPA